MIRTTALLAVVLAGLLAAASPTAATASGTTPETWTIDADHPLADAEAVADYQESGQVSHSFSRADLTVTIAADASSIGVDGYRSDAIRHYIQFSYNEEIDREVRIYVPSGYWHPHRKSGAEALEDDSVTAEFQPVQNGSYTAITIELTKPGTYTIPVQKAHSSVVAARDKGRDIVENATGVGLPSISGDGGGEWSYIDGGGLAGNTTPSVPGDATLQYNAGTTDEERWLTVPQCDGSEQPVCYYERQGDDKKYVRAGVTDPPRVRYRSGGGGGLLSGTVFQDAWKAVEDAIQDASEALGLGGSDGENAVVLLAIGYYSRCRRRKEST